ncbi:MAG: hypothetical protein JW751_11035 [Polyangiaceae bacterium]|nr:hypothetical protein [Polyangiaceae bacterium]
MAQRLHPLCLMVAVTGLGLLPAPALAQQSSTEERAPAAAPTLSNATTADETAASAPGGDTPGTGGPSAAAAPPAALSAPSASPSVAAPTERPLDATSPEAPTAKTATAPSSPAPIATTATAPSSQEPTATAASAREGHRVLGVALGAELGFLSALHHTVQFSKDGSRIDYVKDAGQDVLFPFARLGAELFLRERTAITFVYQPLKLVTQEVAPRDLTIDDEFFTQGTPMTFTYGFPFWRAGIARDVLRSPRHDLWLGGGLQIRDATIEFASRDGEQLVTNRNVGPVPLLRAAGRVTFPSGRFLEGEVDGFYAPIKYINGADTDVEGAVVDLSVRGGTPIAEVGEVFLNLRYFGGGADGTGSDDGPGDGYTSNWLHFLTLSLGARVRAL